MIGFPVSALVRLAAGLLFVAITGGMVWGIDFRRNVHPVHAAESTVGTAMPAPEVRALPLHLESTYPVARWSVTVLGRAQSANSSDVWHWDGAVSLRRDDEILIQATSAADIPAPYRCLRIRLGVQPERVVWGEGDITTTCMAPP